jgi:hypothetical protein
LIPYLDASNIMVGICVSGIRINQEKTEARYPKFPLNECAGAFVTKNGETVLPRRASERP